jgi:hypothetical protein
VEHGGGADASAEVLGIGGDREQRFSRRAKQEVVNHRLVLAGDWSDLGGQREDYVEIADRQQIGLAGRKPIRRRRTLTLWAMAVSTRVVGDAAVAAILATLDMARRARPSGTARSQTSPGAGAGSHARHWLGASRLHGDQRRLRPPASGGARPPC